MEWENPMTVRRPAIATSVLACLCAVVAGAAADETHPHIKIRGIYGGVPVELLEDGKTLKDYGVNAIFMGSGGINTERMALLKKHGAKVFAEFNTMHVAGYLKDHPDAAPVGVDGKVCPPPQGWQGICPTHPAYRQFRMDAFRQVLSDFEIDGIWLDYHHSHASWERAEPDMPDTCFCERCIAQFAKDTGTKLPDESPPQLAGLLLDKHKERWVQWRCDVFTDWVREFRSIIERNAPRSPARHVPLPLDRHGFRWGPAQQAGHRPESAGRVRRRVQHHALSRPLRACERSAVDLAADGVVGQSSWDQGRTGRTPQDLAHRATLGLGRNGAGRPGAVRTGARHASSCHRRDGLRLGLAAQTAREG